MNICIFSLFFLAVVVTSFSSSSFSASSGRQKRRLQLPVCDTPELSPQQGLFLEPVDIKVTTGSSDTTIKVESNVTTTTLHSGDKLHLEPASGMGVYVVIAYAEGPGCSKSQNVTGRYTLTRQASPPQIESTVQRLPVPATVHLVSDTEGASIFYTVDGSFPTLDSKSYDASKGIVLREPGEYTIQAISTAQGMLVSDVTSFALTVLDRARTPTPVPPPGAYEDSVRVTLSCTGTVYYSLDGSMPTTNDTTAHVPCGGQVEVGGGPGKVLLSVVAATEGKASSQTAQYLYTLVRTHQDTWHASSDDADDLGVQPKVDVLVVTKRFTAPDRDVRGRLMVLHNPVGHFSVAPPVGGCTAGLSLPSETGRAFDPATLPPSSPAGATWGKLPKKLDVARLDAAFTAARRLGCQVVTNAGFFDVPTGACEGNVVTGRQVLSTSKKHNVNFGVRNGSFVTGYVSQAEIESTVAPFDTLVSGIGWLVRGGQEYLEESLAASGDAEDLTAQSTGNTFATVKSARTILGHDAHGRLLLLQMEGETWVRGVGLYEIASFARELGFYSAINLDGGGSATMTVNHTLVSEPSWKCGDMNTLGSAVRDSERVFANAAAVGAFGPEGLQAAARCEKPVASIACVHARMPPGYLERAGTTAKSTESSANTDGGTNRSDVNGAGKKEQDGGSDGAEGQKMNGNPNPPTAPEVPQEGTGGIDSTPGEGSSEKEKVLAYNQGGGPPMTLEYFVSGLAAVVTAVIILGCVAKVVTMCRTNSRSSIPPDQQEMELGNASSSPVPQRSVGGFQNTYYSPTTSVGYSGVTYDDISDDDDEINPFYLGSR